MQLGLLNQVIDDLGLASHHRCDHWRTQLARAAVVAKLGGQEPLHARGDGGVDEESLGVDLGHGDGGYDGILATQGFGEGLDRLQVRLTDLNAVWECRRRGLARDGGDLEAGCEKGFGDRDPDGARGLKKFVLVNSCQIIPFGLGR
jgi:hypothetical protein